MSGDLLSVVATPGVRITRADVLRALIVTGVEAMERRAPGAAGTGGGR
ncbi:MAG: hypothetical protein QM820_38865 [Minicystis sp.]